MLGYRNVANLNGFDLAQDACSAAIVSYSDGPEQLSRDRRPILG
jgi:hypothetical protein